MTKRAKIEHFLKQGLKYKEIARITNSTYRYVANVALDLRTGAISRSQRKYYNSESRKAWLKNNPQKKLAYQQKFDRKRQDRTRPSARKHRQRYTIRELEYLKENANKKTTEELALDLNRTFNAIENALVKFGIKRSSPPN